jgi:hypothetical protein
MAVRLLGATAAQTGNALHNTANIFLTRFQAVESGDVDTIKVYAGTASTDLKVAIYSDSGGEPNALLGDGNLAVSVVNSWNDVPMVSVPFVTVINGTYYWLGIRVGAINGAKYDNTSGTMRYKALAHASAWPDPAGSGYTSDSFYSSLAGWGDILVAQKSPIQVVFMN